MLWAEFLAAENDVYYFRSPDLFDFLNWMPLFEKLSKLSHILAYFYPFKVVISSKLKLPAKGKTMPPGYTDVIEIQKQFPYTKEGSQAGNNRAFSVWKFVSNWDEWDQRPHSIPANS